MGSANDLGRRLEAIGLSSFREYHVRSAAVEWLKLLGAILAGLLLVLLAISGADPGLVNIGGMTLLVFVCVAAETRKLWAWRWYWVSLSVAFVLHCGTLLLIVRRIGTTFPTMYDFVVGVPEMVVLYLILNCLAG